MTLVYLATLLVFYVFARTRKPVRTSTAFDDEIWRFGDLAIWRFNE